MLELQQKSLDEFKNKTVLNKISSFYVIYVPLRLRTAGRAWCGGVCETHWATCHNVWYYFYGISAN